MTHEHGPQAEPFAAFGPKIPARSKQPNIEGEGTLEDKQAKRRRQQRRSSQEVSEPHKRNRLHELDSASFARATWPNNPFSVARVLGSMELRGIGTFCTSIF